MYLSGSLRRPKAFLSGAGSVDLAGEWVLWGSMLSPFSLKLEAMLRFSGLRHRWLPAQGRFGEALRFALRRERVVRRRLPLTWPAMTDLDEFPLVPFLFGPRGENLYDSTAIGEWLDRNGLTRASPLLPSDDDTLRFALRLVDEACDEVGLYLVHHNRWVVAARDNDAGARLASEMRPLAGLGAVLLRRSFPARQVRRLPYLFSVATAGQGFADLPVRLRPPSRLGYPATHALLEEAFAALLGAVEPVLAKQPFLFGARFTLADASLYGQLGMNRSDPSAYARVRRAAPHVHAWIERLARGDFSGHDPSAALRLDDAHGPLFQWIGTTFVPLMQQNLAAWERHQASGETRFNEAGFDAGHGHYDGTLRGHPFRSVVKTFQVRVWRDLCRSWDSLPARSRARFAAWLPLDEGLRDECAGSGAAEVRD